MGIHISRGYTYHCDSGQASHGERAGVRRGGLGSGVTRPPFPDPRRTGTATQTKGLEQGMWRVLLVLLFNYILLSSVSIFNCNFVYLRMRN